MKVGIAGVDDNGEIVQLRLSPCGELESLWKRTHGGKILSIPMAALHVTLCPSAGGVALPAPPVELELGDLPEMVARADKVSVFLRLSEVAQEEMRQYIGRIEAVSGVSGLLDPNRVFHVSLSNLTGAPRDSIAKVWEHSPVPYFVSDYARFVARAIRRPSRDLCA